MPEGLLAVLLLAGGPAIAALAGGWLALRHPTSTLVSSIAYGFAGGAMLGVVALEMVPRGLEAAGLWPVAGMLAVGFTAVYAFDLAMHGGMAAGEHAQQRRRVRIYQRQRKVVGGNATVLAGASSLEEVIEGLTIGVAFALDPAMAMVVAVAVLINNAGESVAIGELFRQERGDVDRARRETIRWTGTIALALVVSALVGWLILRDLPVEALGFLVAGGAGGLLYLTLSDLVPEAQEHHFQHSGAIAGGLGFVLILIVAGLLEGL